MARTPHKLTPLQEAFVNEYMIDFSPTKAYIRAGGKKENAKNGCRVLNEPAVQEELAKRKAQISKKYELTQDRIINELIKIAFADRTEISKLVEENKVDRYGNVVTDEEGNPVKELKVKLTVTDLLTSFEKGAISGYKQTKKGIEVSTYDKMKALELLGKHIGMFDDRLHVTGDLDQKVNILGDILDQLNGGNNE